MERITFFRTTAMQKGEYVSFMSETDRQLVANDVNRMRLGGLHPLFKDKLLLVQQTHGVLPGNSLTEAKNNAEYYRDTRYVAFSIAVRSATYNSDPAISEAADRVLKVVDEIGNPTKLSDSKGTARLFNLQTNLQPYSADIQLIGVDGRLAELVSANGEFVRLQDEWYKAGGEKPSGNMFAARQQLDPVYKNIVNCINSFAVINGVAAYESFILAHNKLIAQYKTIIASRKTRAKKAAQDDSAETAE
ncbi:MAG: DUF6261 family protein [Bacteroidales bacterium]|jgi:hypothetical protein|nr:DUF6261 family protein [Bacteroidales bacterium]